MITPGFILAVIFGLPAMTFVFVWAIRKNALKVEELKLRKQILELEVRKQETSMAFIAAENAREDRLLSTSIAEAGAGS